MVERQFWKLNREAIAGNGKLDFWRMADVARDAVEASWKLLALRIPVHRRDLLRFITSCHDLEVELGRRSKAPYHERLCLFGCGEVEDECHFLFRCEAHQDRRNDLIEKLRKSRRRLPDLEFNMEAV